MILGIVFSPEIIALIVVASVVGFVILGAVLYFISKKMKPKKFSKQWKIIQSKLPKQENWSEALIEADVLLDDGLKRKNFTGNTVGEKLVKAEKIFTNKDEVWFGHKLSKKVKEQPDTKIKKSDMKRALLGIRKGLKDLEAL